jgi:hypothetical protein
MIYQTPHGKSSIDPEQLRYKICTYFAIENDTVHDFRRKAGRRWPAS